MFPGPVWGLARALWGTCFVGYMSRRTVVQWPQRQHTFETKTPCPRDKKKRHPLVERTLIFPIPTCNGHPRQHLVRSDTAFEDHAKTCLDELDPEDDQSLGQQVQCLVRYFRVTSKLKPAIIFYCQVAWLIM